MNFALRTALPHDARDVFAWHERPGAFERLAPPWENVRVVEQAKTLRDGERVVLEVATGPIKQRWVAEIRDVRPGEQFVDVQVSGPFAAWRHTHAFEAAGEGRCTMHDQVTLRLPMQAVSGLVASGFVKSKLARMFRYRHETLKADLAAHQRLELSPMKIAISGATGLVGSSLSAFLSTGGHDIVPISRRALPRGVVWDPAKGFTKGTGALEGVAAVVHLAGENIAGGRWTDARKRAIRESRLQGTRSLCEGLAKLPTKPSVLVSASAVGIYGDLGDKWADESTPAGKGFLEDLAVAWEKATKPARDAGIRVVHARVGIVLSPAGGALKKMLTPFQVGVGGRLGSGEQYMSWVSIDDAIGGLAHAIATPSIDGPMNLVAPNPVTNAEFTKVLARVLRRPVGPPVPAFALRLLYGELADAALLSGVRVRPGVLLSSAYQFRHPDLEGALRHVLGK